MNLIFKIFNLQPVLFYPKWKNQPRLISYKRDIRNIYDKVLLIKNFDKKNFASKEIPFPQAILARDLKKPTKSSQRKQVYMYGACLHLFENEHNVDTTRKILDFIRKKYNDKDLIYLPHPLENTKKIKPYLKGFRICRDGTKANFLIDREKIHSVFSFFSTASLSAINFGFNAYTFLELFEFNQDRNFKNRYREYFSDSPSEFYIKNLSKHPSAYFTKKKYKDKLEENQKTVKSKLNQLFD